MKKQFIFIGLALILCAFTFCNRSSDTLESVSIKDYSKEERVIDINNQKTGDVFVYKTDFIGAGYKIVMFHDYSGTLQMYDCFYGSEEEYDLANYSWRNDTTLLVTLVNSEKKNEFDIEFSGNGSSTGMKLEE